MVRFVLVGAAAAANIGNIEPGHSFTQSLLLSLHLPGSGDPSSPRIWWRFRRCFKFLSTNLWQSHCQAGQQPFLMSMTSNSVLFWQAVCTTASLALSVQSSLVIWHTSLWYTGMLQQKVTLQLCKCSEIPLGATDRTDPHIATLYRVIALCTVNQCRVQSSAKVSPFQCS